MKSRNGTVSNLSEGDVSASIFYRMLYYWIRAYGHNSNRNFLVFRRVVLIRGTYFKRQRTAIWSFVTRGLFANYFYFTVMC